MVNSIKIKFNDTTYVDKSRPNGNFYEEERLIVGSVNNNLPNSNHYKTLLRFHISDLNYDLVDSIFLFLFIENVKFTNNKDANIGISGTTNNSHISNINWWTFPKKSTSKQINLSIPYEAIGKYIKIDISNIIKSLTPNNNMYNLTIESMNFNCNSVVQFASNNSPNPPYVIISNNISKENNNALSPEYNKDSTYYTNSNSINLATSSNNYKTNETIYNKIFSQLNDQYSKFNLLEENLKYLCDYINILNTKIDIINKNIDTIISSPNKSDDILDEVDSKLTESISKLNSNLSKISSPILSLIEIMENVTIEPLDTDVNIN